MYASVHSLIHALLTFLFEQYHLTILSVNFNLKNLMPPGHITSKMNHQIFESAHKKVITFILCISIFSYFFLNLFIFFCLKYMLLNVNCAIILEFQALTPCQVINTY